MNLNKTSQLYQKEKIEGMIKGLYGPSALNGSFFNYLLQVDHLKDCIYEYMNGLYDPVYSKMLIMKLTNAIVVNYERNNRRVLVASQPIGFLVDPSNVCNLHCPGCIHTSKAAWKEHKDWPSKLLDRENFAHLLKEYGTNATTINLYNYGEPFVNKNTTDYIRQAKDYLLNTVISTNLSLEIDADDIVTSGLDYMIMSIDGASHETYTTFRGGGDFNVVISNAKKLVEAKRRQKRRTPILIWQFLTFKHNIHELETARKMSNEMGVDTFVVLTPFNVSHDDPSIISVDHPENGKEWRVMWDSSYFDKSHVPDFPDIVRKNVQEQFEMGWAGRAKALGLKEEEKYNGDRKFCDWLYLNTVVDADGRILPCCDAPSDERKLVYGNIKENIKSHFNLKKYELSRLYFRDNDLYKKEFECSGIEDEPHCAKCQNYNTVLPAIDSSRFQPYLDKFHFYDFLTYRNLIQ